jgi:hypothetical protein
MDFIVFEHDQECVLAAFRRGEIDFVAGVSEVAETEFFRYIGAHCIRPGSILVSAVDAKAPV